MKLQISGVALLGIALLAGQARAGILETINFDNLANVTTVTNQYANVIFSSSGGDVVLTAAENNSAFVNPPYLGSFPNVICTGTVPAPSNLSSLDCTHDITLTFTALVDNITFTAFGNQTPAPGQFALADVYQGSILTPILTHPNTPLNVSHTVHCGAPTTDCAGDPQSLAFTGITKLVIRGNTDPAGTAYDDFAFLVETPEPSTLLLTGLCGIVWAGRRFLARKSM